MLKTKIAFSLILVFLTFIGKTQECTLSIQGKVIDQKTKKSIEFANVYLEKTLQGTSSDSLGFFNLSSVCPDNYHLVISHIGCETTELFFKLKKDTVITIELDHSSHLLNEVAVEEDGRTLSLSESSTIGEKKISENANQNLAGMLENLSGVSVLKNGNGIGKPVVQGLYGNRLTILNNGIAQSGQQWGVDHSPEIDPLVATHIHVIKGVGALEYMGSNLGSYILIEPEHIEKEPHLHGKATYFYETNGKGNGVNLQLKQHSKWFAWKISGTLKKRGDLNTPDYFLTNTGSEEGNVAIQLEKEFSKKWKSSLYLSSFNSNIGILRGSHIGNLTDLETALNREEPFFTEDVFAYKIQAPKQRVNHQLLKWKNNYQFSEKQWLEVVYATQFNKREEFDIRRGDRTDEPALSLEQKSHFFETKFTRYLSDSLKLKAGIQYNRTENLNLPETGVLPLIPDYFSNEYGVFGLLSKDWEKLKIETGIRYDLEERKVATISNTVPRKVVRYATKYNNLTLHFGGNYSFSKHNKLAYNIGAASRNPEVNELYSNGLHQGVSGIEEGDVNLKKENSLKHSLSFETVQKEKLSIKLLGYYQQIEDYIYLAPQDEVRLTIRGAFPLFNYEQTNALIYGADLNASYEINRSFSGVVTYSFIKGRDETNNTPLINIPSSSIRGELHYEVPVARGFENVEFQLNVKHVTQREEEIEALDFVAPPEAYTLLGARISAEKQLKKLRLNFFVSITNLTNVEYRDYLNRQRYFADDLGRNTVFGVVVKF